MSQIALQNEAQKGLAVIRPPGHHAEADEANGFCLFNNVAMAAKYALEMHDVKRILIVDWDVHHGNGIQVSFSNDLIHSFHGVLKSFRLVKFCLGSISSTFYVQLLRQQSCTSKVQT